MFKDFIASITHNVISLIGTALAVASLVLMGCLFAMEQFGFEGGPYIGILTYLILPMIFVVGLLLIPIGALLYRRKLRRQHGEEAAAALRAQGHDAHAVQLDLTSSESIDAAVETIRSDFGRLDVLVNNSALLVDVGIDPSDLEESMLRDVFEVNFFGPFRLTRGLTGLLRESPHGRVVNMATTVASLNELADPDSVVQDDVCPAYQTSKAAANAMTLVFARELRSAGVKVNSACPGWVMTDMGENEDLPDYGDAAKPKTPAEGADTPVWLATLPDDGPTAGFFADRAPRAW